MVLVALVVTSGATHIGTSREGRGGGGGGLHGSKKGWEKRPVNVIASEQL